MSEHSPSTRSQAGLARWGRWAARHVWAVVGTWIIVIGLIALLANQFGSAFATSFQIPGSETQHVVDLLASEFPEMSGDSATIVYKTNGVPVTDPAVQQKVNALLGEVKSLPHVVALTTPEQNPMQVSPSGNIAFTSIAYDVSAIDVSKDDVHALFDMVDKASDDTVTFEVGGQIASMGEVEIGGKSELIGIGLAMLIMVLMFGSIVAMGLPIITALIGVGAATLALPLLANAFTFSNSISPAFLSMMGLGVGIDYALLIVNRYRDNRLHGEAHIDAVGTAINTAGRSVIFAGTTVAIGLLGLAVMGIPFVTGLGITGALVVVTSVCVAVLLMPALLGLVGNKILDWKIPGLGNESISKDSFWFRWGRMMMSHPFVISILTLALLLVTASPVLDQRLGLSDAGSNPTSYHTRRAYDLMTEGFGPGSNGPLLISVEGANGLDQAKLAELTTAIQKVPGVAFASPAMPAKSGKAAVIQVVPATGPQDAKTEDLIHTLRNDAIPSVLDTTTMRGSLGGSTAANIDLSEKISDRLPAFYAIVIVLSFILLMTVFQSLVVPIKASLMTLLSVYAASGAIVAVFQWGWLKSLIGLENTGPIESFLPMILFGVLFGLSMDYEVFLLTRVHEEHTRGVPAKQAMLDGVGYSGKVVAAAGAIMGAVFLSFALGDLRMLKMLGFGLGFAILVDAFVVRLILVPAIMAILDEKAWWFPGWLRRIVPSLHVE